jgi:hypothetical protein
MEPIRGGVAYIRRNGNLLKLKSQVTVKPGGPIKTAKAGADGHPIITVEHQPGMVETTLSWDPKMDLQEFQLGEGDTIAIGFNNGRRGVLSDATYVGEFEVTSDEAELRAAWAGTWTWD